MDKLTEGKMKKRKRQLSKVVVPVKPPPCPKKQTGDDGDYKVPVDVDENLLEQLYWEYTERVKTVSSNRDLFKGFMRKFARHELGQREIREVVG